MGRPPLYYKRIHTSVSPKDLDRIDVLVGEKGRAAFIREAILKLLEVREYEAKLYEK